MTIKDLSVLDARKIFELSQDFADAWKESQLINGFEKGNLKAEGCFIEGQLVGYILYTPSTDFCDLEMIFVCEQARNKGVAISLITAMQEKVKALSPKIMLEVREGNIPAIALYEKMGYKTISTRKKYYLDGENALIMSKEF